MIGRIKNKELPKLEYSFEHASRKNLNVTFEINSD